ncbi:MAG: phosphoenolpyruvate--protein phosphotransferase [Deltaproteobacteria bacterium]|nr:phosphoenolpyruvate--protein phosphotransferase [Deltaproteobacteria bacterium]
MQNHLELLCDLSELNWIFNESQSIDLFLAKLVDMVAGHMQTTVCSLYLYEEEQRELRLKATHGLKAGAVGVVRMLEGQGLTGTALAEKRTIVAAKASLHPAYKFFGGLNEELYEAFMAVPILRGINKIGVIVLQREEEKPFSQAEVTVTQTIASQLANIIENVRLLGHIERRSDAVNISKPKIELALVHGQSASQGLVKGRALVLRRYQDLSEYLAEMPLKGLTLNDFHECVKKTEVQLEMIQSEVEAQLSDVASLIFSAHLLMLKDSSLLAKIETLIAQGSSPGAAIVETADFYISHFSRVEDHYIREKADDVRDLALRLLRNLSGPQDDLGDLGDKVVIADQLLPSDILKLSHEKILGIVLVSGGVTSHVALLARSLGIPLVIADEPQLLALDRNSFVLLDATIGNVYVNPAPSVIEIFTKKQQEVEIDEAEIAELTMTRDGEKVFLYSNINLLSDLKMANRYRAQGIGLYRSEIPFLVRSDFPSEAEQFLVYQRLAAGMPGKPLVFRTLDIGGDKVLSYYHHEKEENPFMGMRSIRFSLGHKDIFARQLRAVMRACAESDLRIMFPMVSSLEEFLEARQVLYDCQQELKAEGEKFCQAPKIGIMVEIPAVVDILDDLAGEADFFSIGTNDLIQYLLAVDRTNEKVASFYVPHHPAVLRTLKRIMQSASRHNVPVSICGEMASREIYLPFLLGIGVRNLSLDPVFLPRIKKACAAINLPEAKTVAQKLLRLSSIKEIEKLLG